MPADTYRKHARRKEVKRLNEQNEVSILSEKIISGVVEEKERVAVCKGIPLKVINAAKSVNTRKSQRGQADLKKADSSESIIPSLSPFLKGPRHRIEASLKTSMEQVNKAQKLWQEESSESWTPFRLRESSLQESGSASSTECEMKTPTSFLSNLHRIMDAIGAQLPDNPKLSIVKPAIEVTDVKECKHKTTLQGASAMIIYLIGLLGDKGKELLSDGKQKKWLDSVNRVVEKNAMLRRVTAIQERDVMLIHDYDADGHGPLLKGGEQQRITDLLESQLWIAEGQLKQEKTTRDELKSMLDDTQHRLAYTTESMSSFLASMHRLLLTWNDDETSTEMAIPLPPLPANTLDSNNEGDPLSHPRKLSEVLTTAWANITKIRTATTGPLTSLRLNHDIPISPPMLTKIPLKLVRPCRKVPLSPVNKPVLALPEIADPHRKRHKSKVLTEAMHLQLLRSIEGPEHVDN